MEREREKVREGISGLSCASQIRICYMATPILLLDIHRMPSLGLSSLNLF